MAKRKVKYAPEVVSIEAFVTASHLCSLRRIQPGVFEAYDALALHGETMYELGAMPFSKFDERGRMNRKLFNTLINKVNEVLKNRNLTVISYRERARIWSEAMKAMIAAPTK